MKKFILSIILVLNVFFVKQYAQVTLDPFFANSSDTVIVYYDATQGNAALVGQTQIYAHCGVITNLSTSPSDWKYVKGVWGTPDPNVIMTNQGNDIHTIEIDIPNFFNVPLGEQILELAFVFRTADGSIVGRTASGGDIYAPIYSGFGATLITPNEDFFFVEGNEIINVEALASEQADIKIFVDQTQVASGSGITSLSYSLNTANYSLDKHFIIMEAVSGLDTIRDTSYYVYLHPPVVAALPLGVKDGVNEINDSTVVIKLTAPHKPFAYVIGDFSNWEFDSDFQMNVTPDSSAFWIQISGLQPNVPYRYQFVVDSGLIRVADPYARMVLDPWNDPYIPSSVYPNVLPYPSEKTGEIVGVFEINKPQYVWDTSINFTRPSNKDLRVYELLIRDYSTQQSYQTVIDSLPYLKKLGINAIELMPINEFEGNNSWGYNPSFHFAVDKFYGPEEKLKELVEEAHKLGIAIIIDMVLNHQFGQSPMVRLYFDGAAGKPSADNPWFLQNAAHDFNVGYDFNHESPWTRKFVDDVMRFWVEEFHVDGYRMDLSKGFTSNITIGNVGLWGQYDSSRVYNLSRMADSVWAFNPETYIILEHFADNTEEKVLADYGFMLWGNGNYDYRNLSKGTTANLSWSSYKARNWANPNLVYYMESHDEERMMYTNSKEGIIKPSYNIRETHVGLKRAELATVYFLSTPGPKMIWQFGEMGYDLSINRCTNGSVNSNCRLDPKPPHWEYLENSDRKRLFEVYAAMNALRENYPVFTTNIFTLDAAAGVKSIKMVDSSMYAYTICNFNTVETTASKSIHKTGVWYEYFTGDSIEVSGSSYEFTLAAGEYRVYTTKRLQKPDITASMEELAANGNLLVYPNPSRDVMNVALPFSLKSSNEIQVFDLSGRQVQADVNGNEDFYQISVSNLKPGMYFILVAHEGSVLKQMVVVE